MDYNIIPVAEQRSLTAQPITEDLYTRWTMYIGKSQKTQESYTRAIKQFALYLSSRNINFPRREDVIEFKRELEARELKPTTISAYIASVRLFFRWTSLEGLYPNIADRIEGAKLDKGFKKDYLTSKQAGKLLSSIDRTTVNGLRDYAITALMLTCGLRTVEISRANIEDMRPNGDCMALYIQGKGHQEREDYVKLPQPVEDAIRAYLKTRKNVEPKDPLFASLSHRDYNERITTKSVSRLVAEALEKADLKTKRVTAHSLRHSCAVINLVNGGSLADTQGLLRHSSPEITKIYSHLIERANNNSEFRISKAIFGS